MLQLTPDARAELWRQLIEIVEDYARRVHSVRVTPAMEPEKIRDELRALKFDRAWDPADALDFAAGKLWQYQTRR